MTSTLSSPFVTTFGMVMRGLQRRGQGHARHAGNFRYGLEGGRVGVG